MGRNTTWEKGFRKSPKQSFLGFKKKKTTSATYEMETSLGWVNSFMALFIHSLIHSCIIIIIFNCDIFVCLLFFFARVIKMQCGSGDSTTRTRHKSKILYLSPFLKAKWKNGSFGSVSLRVHFHCCTRRSRRLGGPGGAGAAEAQGL